MMRPKLWRLGDWVRQVLWGVTSMQWSREGQPVNQQQCQDLSRLSDVDGEQTVACLVQSYTRATVAQSKWKHVTSHREQLRQLYPFIITCYHLHRREISLTYHCRQSTPFLLFHPNDTTSFYLHLKRKYKGCAVFACSRNICRSVFFWLHIHCSAPFSCLPLFSTTFHVRLISVHKVYYHFSLLTSVSTPLLTCSSQCFSLLQVYRHFF